MSNYLNIEKIKIRLQSITYEPFTSLISFLCNIQDKERFIDKQKYIKQYLKENEIDVKLLRDEVIRLRARLKELLAKL